MIRLNSCTILGYIRMPIIHNNVVYYTRITILGVAISGEIDTSISGYQYGDYACRCLVLVCQREQSRYSLYYGEDKFLRIQ